MGIVPVEIDLLATMVELDTVVPLADRFTESAFESVPEIRRPDGSGEMFHVSIAARMRVISASVNSNSLGCQNGIPHGNPLLTAAALTIACGFRRWVSLFNRNAFVTRPERCCTAKPLVTAFIVK
jgi:hypothetical protein